jgi:DegV family protein with EDD domain
MKEVAPLKRVKIVTDSSASIPAHICVALGITVMPIPIQFGTETFVDGVDPAAVFYERLMALAEPPKTSTPSPGTFLATYERLAEEATAIISIHLLASKSGVVNTASLAADLVPGIAIFIVDSGTTTLGLGLLAIAAAKAAQMGQSAEEIIAYLHTLIPRVHIHAAIREMTQLRKSGRVSLGQAFLAGALAIKPILYIGQSAIDVADRVRSWPRAVDRMVELASERTLNGRVAMAVVHTNAEEEATALLARVRSQFNCPHPFIAEAGTALASHAGPGALGIVTMQIE